MHERGRPDTAENRMGSTNHDPMQNAPLPDEEREDSGTVIPAGESPIGVSDQPPRPPGAQEQDPHGSFATSVFLGSLTAAIGSLPAILWAHSRGISVGTVTWICLWCFLGGFISGRCLRRGLRFHAWRFLWLAAVSPALPIWIFTVVALRMGVEMETRTLLPAFLACGASVAGSVTGCCFRGERLGRVGADSLVRAVVKTAVALILSTGVTVLSFIGGVYVLDRVNPWHDWDAVVLPFVCSGVLAPFLGGLVSGVLMAWFAHGVRVRYRSLALAGPATPLVLMGVVFAGSSGEWALLVLICVIAAVIPFLGAIVGYRFVVGRRSSHQEKRNTTPPDEEAREATTARE